MRSDWNGQTHAGLQDNFFLVLALSAPHFTKTRHHKPDLFDSAMHYRLRDLACAEFEMSHAAARQAQENANVGAVGRDGGWRSRKLHGGEGIHGFDLTMARADSDAKSASGIEARSGSQGNASRRQIWE
jgi:hypothetical protein